MAVQILRGLYLLNFITRAIITLSGQAHSFPQRHPSVGQYTLASGATIKSHISMKLTSSEVLWYPRKAAFVTTHFLSYHH